MPIAALSEIAVRAIGSSQVLTDPCSVVKELIDNALDAQATSIFVEISLNTLDVIQIKDNGYGIGPEDRAMVCRRYCTSKIRNLEDLKDIGGRSLGFRGEALASAAELSGSLMVTTRIEGEPVAVSLTVERNGEIKSQEKASHPTGSTVRVVDFLKHLPVRRQTAFKSAPKTVAKIKQTLQAYAIARPSTRLSLKVLKAKNDKGNWVYAPKAGASVPDAAMKVVDKTITGHCQWISWCSSEMATPALDTATEPEDLQDKESIDSPYRIEAFLPKPAAAKDDVLFVDQIRLLSILETFFKSVYGELEVTRDKKVQKTKSQRETTDQKGFDLLLAREPQRLACSISLSTDIPTIEIVKNSCRKSSTGEQWQVDVDDVVEPERAWTETYQLSTESVAPSRAEKIDRNSREHQSPDHSPGDHDAAFGESSSKGNSTWRFSMYDGDEEDLEELDNPSTRPTEEHTVDGEGLGDVNVSNPWTIAKMNSFARPGRSTEPGCANGNIVENGQLMTPARERMGHRTELIVPSNESVHRSRADIANLQTPQHTLRSPSPSPKNISSSGAWHFPSKAWGRAPPEPRNDKTKLRALERDGGGALDTWIRSSPSIGQPADRIEDGHFTRGLAGDSRTDALDASRRFHADSNNFISARTLQRGTQLSDIPEAPHKRTPRLGLRKQHRQGAIHKPFISPVNDPSKVWFDIEPQRRARPPPQAQSQSGRKAIATTAPIRYESESVDNIEETSLLNPTPPPSHTPQVNLEDLMEYEHRKSAATRAYKASLHNQDKGRLSSTSSPHKNRYEAAKAALTRSKDAAVNKTTNTPPIFADGDPRAYLIRVRKREEDAAAQRHSTPSGGTTHQLRRARTAMLPLETIAADRRVHNLVLHVATDVSSVKKRVEQAMDSDDHVRTGQIACAVLAMISDGDVRAWERKLSDLLDERYGCAENGDRTEEMAWDLSSALRQHAAAHS